MKIVKYLLPALVAFPAVLFLVAADDHGVAKYSSVADRNFAVSTADYDVLHSNGYEMYRAHYAR